MATSPGQGLPRLEDCLDSYVAAVAEVGGPVPDQPLSEADLDAIDADLAPLAVPNALRTVWRGFQAPELVPFPSWLPARDTLEIWRTEQDDFGILPMALFPVAYASHFYLTVDLTDAPHAGAPLWEVDYIDGVARLRHRSLAAFFAAAADAIRRGLLTWADGYAHLEGEAWAAVIAEWDGRVPLVAGTEVEVDIGDPLAWPARWRLASGIDAAAAQPRGATTTIRQLLDDRPGEVATIVGRIVGLAGSVESSRLTLDDGSGELVIWCDRRVDPFRRAGMRRDVEVDLVLLRTAGTGRGKSQELDAWQVRVQRAALSGDMSGAQQMAMEVLSLLNPETCDAVALAVRPSSDRKPPA
jgi:hypothetical protein